MQCQTKAEAIELSKRIVAEWRPTVSGRAWVSGLPFPQPDDVVMAGRIAQVFGVEDLDVARALRQLYRKHVSYLLKDGFPYALNRSWNMGIADEAPRSVGLGAIAYYHQLSTLPDPIPPKRSWWSILKSTILGRGHDANPAERQSKSSKETSN